MSDHAGDLIAFLRSLRAVREYTSEPVSDDVIRDILEVGRWSGSASNRQPAEVVVVRDRAVLQQIGEDGVRAAAGAPLVGGERLTVEVDRGAADRMLGELEVAHARQDPARGRHHLRADSVAGKAGDPGGAHGRRASMLRRT